MVPAFAGMTLVAFAGMTLLPLVASNSLPKPVFVGHFRGMAEHDVTRRDFIARTGKVALGAMVAPRFMAAETVKRAPGSTLNVAIAGFGGQGSVNAEALAEICNIVAICDVDADRMIMKKLADPDGKGTPARLRLEKRGKTVRLYVAGKDGDLHYSGAAAQITFTEPF